MSLAEKRMLKGLFILTALLAVFPTVAACANNVCTTDFAPITARGKMLEAYDQAAWHATDAVQAAKPTEGSVVRYIAEETDAGWVVAFGKLNGSRDRFLIAYLATQGSTPKDFSVKKNDPPVEDTGFFLFAARAIDMALADFKGNGQQYNVYVVPAVEGQLYVYLEPAQTTNDVIPLGGDVRYLMSADGSTIIETHRMHASILERHSPPPGVKAAAGYHTHVLTDAPEDSDVFYVLRQPAPLPEYIGTIHKCLYVINADGTILTGK